MNVIERGNFYYLAHSFRKAGKVVHREKYLGKRVPAEMALIEEAFLRKCLMEDALIKVDKIKKAFAAEWRQYPNSVKREMLVDFSINFIYNTNAIEGSTLSLEDTEGIIKRKIAPNKPLADIQETLNHARVFLTAINGKKGIDLNLLLEWHKALFKDTKPDIAGRLRDFLVRIGEYRAPDWQDLPKLIKNLFAWYNNAKAMHPIELSARLHYKFEKIHPFGDGNGRIGRMIINSILKSRGYPLLIIQYKKRKAYYHALSKSENDFLNYMIRAYISAHKRHLLT